MQGAAPVAGGDLGVGLVRRLEGGFLVDAEEAVDLRLHVLGPRQGRLGQRQRGHLAAADRLAGLGEGQLVEGQTHVSRLKSASSTRARK